ncbi:MULTISPECIES: PaaI family thioesterase [Bacteroidales]|uniref:PaaI family thioesterase n=1 Tax=Bacteroidales TaxID=171549 RepID=UPI00033CB189|nr:MULTISPECIES: PaaI family thioesterase [Bacteroidales]CCY39429.1 uncharacterized protein possibly involved in aromatic compounds catabolism [Tannerella sp. CAG:118]
MKKIINPWQGMDGYHCYGCAPDNHLGLKMEFYEDGDDIVSVWQPRPEYQGWINTLHGGIQAALADEICGWVVFRKFQTSGVTSKMEIRYLKPMYTTDDRIVLRASVQEQRRNLVQIAACIYNMQNELCTKAVCTYFLFSKEKARAEFHFCDCSVEEREENLL